MICVAIQGRQPHSKVGFLRQPTIVHLLILVFNFTDIHIIQAPESWLAERASWRIVIQLNLVRAVNTIMDIVAAELANSSHWADVSSGFDITEEPIYSDDELSSPSSPSRALKKYAVLRTICSNGLGSICSLRTKQTLNVKRFRAYFASSRLTGNPRI